MPDPEHILCRDADELAATAARTIARIAAAAIAERGRFSCALTGGSTPRATYQLLARRPADAAVAWDKTWLFFGDERFVPPDDERSNYKMAHDSLLAPARIATDHVFAIPTGPEAIGACAERYARTLQLFFAPPVGQPPVFDLILLGMGDDGHVASLFPHAPSLAVIGTTVTCSQPGTLPPPVDRITLTFEVINAARHVLFLVAGNHKAEAVRDVWLGHAAIEDRPAAGVRPAAGQVTWLVDRAAASLATSSAPTV